MPNALTIGTATSTPRSRSQRTVLQQAADDLHTVEFVAVDGGGQKQPGTRAGARIRRAPADSAASRAVYSAAIGISMTRRSPGATDVPPMSNAGAAAQPLPLVLVLPIFAFCSMNSMIMPATSFCGGFFDAAQSGRRVDFHHQRAAVGSQQVDAGDVEPHQRAPPSPRCGAPPASASPGLALPPRCRFERNSPSGACRCIAAMTRCRPRSSECRNLSIP